MKEIRIYYESLEQGVNYIKPIVKSAIGKDVDIIMVRRPKKYSDLNNGSISALLSMTTPDALITGIYNNIEYPLVLVEFTEAVTTEDHELQRTYGAIAAYFAKCYYLKLSGEKKSEKEFGGAVYNPYSTPKIFLERFGYKGYVIAEWATEESNPYTLQRNEQYPSCPPDIDIFSDTIRCAVSAFMENPLAWYDTSISNLESKNSYKEYITSVNKASGLSQLLNSWSNRKDSNLNKLRYFVKKDFIAAKINRFSHAMDPDRGILTFISFLFSSLSKVYGIYALVRPKGNDVIKKEMHSLSNMREKLSVALSKDKGGIPEWLENEFKRCANEAKSLNDVIDIQSVWENNIDRIQENKVVMTLAYWLDGIKFNYNGITLIWDRRKLINSTSSNFLLDFSKFLRFSENTLPTPLKKIEQFVDEDEVTYAIVHNVLIPNGFKLVSVSYPGAQGGNAILPFPENGKSQERIYLDTLALPPVDSGFDVLINESKGMFKISEIKRDVDKISKFQTDSNYKKALKETLCVAQVLDPNQQIHNIVIGVSFGVTDRTITRWNPDKIDFIFRIVNREKWAIGIFKQELKDIIGKIEGDTNFPAVYICDKEN